MDEPPTFEELQDAISATREDKAPGGCGIPAEVWKYGGIKLKDDIWKHEYMPQDWNYANIVPIFKKGSRKECGNYRGISLLSIAGKIMARIILNRLNDKVTPRVLPETQ